MWTSASLIYLICIIGCLCYTLHHQNTSYASIGIDIAISLAFLMFARVKYLFNLLIECKTALIDGANRSSPTESNGSERHCFSANIINGQESVTSSIDSKQTRDNSISILSDASKTFLTMMPNGQISIGSPKIYPSHQSSYIYHNDYGDRSNQSNPNAHLYESPSHLYNYEFDRRCFSTRKHPHSMLNTNQLRGYNHSNSFLSPGRHSVYGKTGNNGTHRTSRLPSSAAFCGLDELMTTSTTTTAAPSYPIYRQHRDSS